jgi:ABC-type sugar transport system ATPase subunit|tara:strand:+ start:63 stop:674 length:612 start_codon:yes stop_codon:yes gene_type:complete
MSLVVENLSHEYSQGKRVLDDFSLKIADREIVAVVGHSGCGKTTLLHCIVGLLTPIKGSVIVDGIDVIKKKTHERGIGIMMQDQPLYEHISVEQNIAFPLRSRMGKKPDVSHILEQLELLPIAKQKVSMCSGGERRRVAFGRAIVTQPAVLLLDEPFVSLNEELRITMSRLISDTGITTLLVTHDTSEAEAIASRIIALKNHP